MKLGLWGVMWRVRCLYVWGESYVCAWGVRCVVCGVVSVVLINSMCLRTPLKQFLIMLPFRYKTLHIVNIYI